MDTLINNTRVSRDLERLGSLERMLSARRRELHRKIDQLYLSAPLDVDAIARLDEFEKQERALSRQRRRLHETIDDLRAEIGLPPWRDRYDDEHELDVAN